MKTRQGFVSNSSSSSYLIQVNEQGAEKCEHCGHQPPGFLQAMERVCSSTQDPDESRIDTGIDSIKETLKERISWYEIGNKSWEELVSVYKKIEDDGTYAWLRVGYHNELVNALFDEAQESGHIKILIDGS